MSHFSPLALTGHCGHKTGIIGHVTVVERGYHRLPAVTRKRLQSLVFQ